MAGCRCKWLITMVSFRPLSRVVPLLQSFSWLINGGYSLLTSWDDPLSKGEMKKTSLARDDCKTLFQVHNGTHQMKELFCEACQRGLKGKGWSMRF